MTVTEDTAHAVKREHRGPERGAVPSLAASLVSPCVGSTSLGVAPSTLGGLGAGRQRVVEGRARRPGSTFPSSPRLPGVAPRASSSTRAERQREGHARCDRPESGELEAAFSVLPAGLGTPGPGSKALGARPPSGAKKLAGTAWRLCPPSCSPNPGIGAVIP